MPPTFILAALVALYLAGGLAVLLAGAVLAFIPARRRYAGPLVLAYVCMGIGTALANALVLGIMSALAYAFAALWRLFSQGRPMPESILVVFVFVIAAVGSTLVGAALGWQIGWRGMLDRPWRRRA